MTEAGDSGTFKNLARSMAGVIIIAALFLAKDILVPLALALILAFLLSPIVGWVERTHLGRVPSVILVVTIAIGVAGTGAWFVGSELVAVVNQLPGYKTNILQKIELLHNKKLTGISKVTNTISELNKDLSSPKSASSRPTGDHGNEKADLGAATRPVPVVVEPASGAISQVRSLLGPLITSLATMLIVLVFIVFMLCKREDLRNRLLRLAGKGRLNVMTQALDEAASRISKYLLIQLAVNVFYGVIFFVGLFFIGVPYPLLWGVLAALLRFIPYIGTLIAAAMATSLAVAVSPGWAPAFLTFSLFVIVEFVVGNFVEPLVYGAHTGLSALAILVAAVFWTLLWGPIGLMLATPLTVCLFVMARFIPALSFLTIILGDEEVLSSEVLFYQRLLALDQEEARKVTDKYLTENSLAQLYDRVIVPSLSMAELDRHQGALEEEREDFILQSTRQLVEEWGTKLKGERAPDPGARLSPVKVFCLPAGDQADGITALMLAQMLEAAGLCGEHLAAGTFVGEMIQAIAKAPIVCICALPPFALPDARAVCKRLHAGLPDLKIVVGVWGSEGAEKKIEDRMKMAGAEIVVSTLSGAVEAIRQLAEVAVLQVRAA